jgi:hypothetical protein
VARLRGTIEAATELGQLDDSWGDWKAPAAVEVALPLDGTESLRGGRVHTFLPLGEDAAAALPRTRRRLAAHGGPAGGLFFQPVRGETVGDEGLAVPDALKNCMSYLHPGLNRVEEEGPTYEARKPGCSWNASGSSGVSTPPACSTTSAAPAPITTRRGCASRPSASLLRLHRSRQSVQSLNLRPLGLYVPSAEGPAIKAAAPTSARKEPHGRPTPPPARRGWMTPP